MSVTETYEPILLATDGVKTDFDFDFSVFANTDVVVALVDPTTLVATAKTLGVDYTVTLNTSTVGGTVVFGTAPVTAKYVSIRRNIPTTQGTDIPSGGLFRESQIENALDKAVLLIQELEERMDRSLLQNPYQTALDLELPLPEAGSALGWNAGETALVNLVPNTDTYLVKASTAQAQAGTEDTAFMTSAKTKDALDALRAKASVAQAQAGTEDTTFMTPSKTKDAIDALAVTLTAAPATDHIAYGTKISLTAGEALVFGDVCYIASAGKALKADADAIATSSAVCMALGTIAGDAAGSFLLIGVARDDSWAWTVGGLVYLSTTPGGLTQTAPSGADDVIQVLGVATHADRMFFNPSLTQVEHV